MKSTIRLIRVPTTLSLAVAALMFAHVAWAQDSSASQRVAPSIVPELKEHTRLFEKKVYKIADNVYSAVGWDLANTILVEGDTGVIIVDTGLGVETARRVAQEFRKLTQKPVVAIVFTHFHPDHVGGVSAYASAEDVRSGKVALYAHETLVDNVENQNGTIGPILGVRNAYSFGASLDSVDRRDMNAGLGPLYSRGTSSFLAPTKTFRDTLDVRIAGVDMHMVHVPSESPDEIAIFLPMNRVLLSAEVIQAPAFPNIHTLRGTFFRDPVAWFKSIDLLRSFKADALVPAHGPPTYGAEKVEEVLRMYRDGIQYVHDQSIRYINHGLTPDELAQTVKLPPHLDSFSPWLRQYYGTVKHSVREIYVGYLGWFEGDPVDLDPIPRIESARRHVALMGGRNCVFTAAEQAYENGDPQWAAELATYLIRIDPQDTQTRVLKANAFRKLGYA